MTTRRTLGIALTFLAAAGFAAAALAHPGLHHDIERVTLMIDADPGRPDLYLDRAVYERLDQQYDEALTDLETVRRLEPGNVPLPLERGLTLSALGRDAEAEKSLTRYIDGSGPKSAPAYAGRADIRARTGRVTAAIADYTAAIGIEADIEYYLERGALQEKAGRWNDAAAGYREGLAKLGGAVNLRLALIRAEVEAGRPAAAITTIDEAMNRPGIQTEWLLRKADVLEGMGRTDEARAERELALAEADRAIEGRATGIHLMARAKVLLALGQTGSAEADLRAALNKSPRYSEARDLLDHITAGTGEARSER